MKGTNAKFIALILLLSVVASRVVYSQELFEIKGATVLIEFDYGDSIVQLQSKHLHVQLDNENAEFSSKLKIETLINTVNGYRPNLGFSNKDDEIEIKGHFEVDHIETSNHAVLNFEFSGMLSHDEVILPIKGLAELQHIGGGGYISCMLGYSFVINKEILSLNNVGAANLKKVKVQVLQTILNHNLN